MQSDRNNVNLRKFTSSFCLHIINNLFSITLIYVLNKIIYEILMNIRLINGNILQHSCACSVNQHKKLNSLIYNKYI